MAGPILKLPAFATSPDTNAALAAVAKQTPLNETDFAHLYKQSLEPNTGASAAERALHPTKEHLVNAFINGDNVSDPERRAFYDYVNKQSHGSQDDMNAPVFKLNTPVGTIAPGAGDLLGAAGLAKGVVGLGKAAAAGDAPGVVAHAAPFVKYEVVRGVLKAAHVPAADEIAYFVAGAPGGKGKAGSAAEPKAPPSLDEQLGVSGGSTGATMDRLPATPPPEPARTSIPLDHATQRGVDVRQVAREMGLPDPAPSHDVRGADDLANLRQELMRRSTAPPTPLPSHGVSAEPGSGVTGESRLPGSRPQSVADIKLAALNEMSDVDLRKTFTEADPATRQQMFESSERVRKLVGPRPQTAPAAATSRAGRQSPSEVASAYAKANGFPAPTPHAPVKSDPAFGAKVADAYEAMQHDPTNPDVAKAYGALKSEISAQFQHITANGGLKVEAWPKSGEPYQSSADMARDINENGHLFYHPTDNSFNAAGAPHPLLDKGASGLTANDELRVVHDYLAHAAGGHNFGPSGEENAYLEHLKLLSPEAGRALATETRGQNSWVNYGPHMRDDAGKLIPAGVSGHLPPKSRPFATQKAGLLPLDLTPEVGRTGAADAKLGIRQELARRLSAKPSFRKLTDAPEKPK